MAELEGRARRQAAEGDAFGVSEGMSIGRTHELSCPPSFRGCGIWAELDGRGASA